MMFPRALVTSPPLTLEEFGPLTSDPAFPKLSPVRHRHMRRRMGRRARGGRGSGDGMGRSVSLAGLSPDQWDYLQEQLEGLLTDDDTRSNGPDYSTVDVLNDFMSETREAVRDGVIATLEEALDDFRRGFPWRHAKVATAIADYLASDLLPVLPVEG